MRKTVIVCIFLFGLLSTAFAQNDKIINYTIFKPENSKYRWVSCSNLIYRYTQHNKWSASKVKLLTDILSSDEDKVNSTLADYWRNHWISKSNEIKDQAQREFDRNNSFRGNQLTNDAKFAEKISTSIDGVTIANITIQNLLNNKIKPQGNALNLPKEQNLQNFRKYFALDYNEAYRQYWEPKDENIPEHYTPAPYIYQSYSLLAPTHELIHTFVERTYSNFYTSLGFQPVSFILKGSEKDMYNYSTGFSLRSKFNFLVKSPLYEKQHLLLSHNSFKDILGKNEQVDLEGVFFGPRISWSIVTNIAYLAYTGKYSNDNFYNIYLSLGSGINYRFNKNWDMSFNIYYLGFDYQIKHNSFDLSKGIWYYAFTPEIETRVHVFDLFNLNPYIQFNYHFKGLERLSTLNAGLALSFFLGEITRIDY